MNKLLEYQKPHCQNLINCIQNEKRALDASDTGTGKTYVAVALCKELNLRPIIICPKSVIPDWRYVLDLFDIIPYSIANYELIKNCRHYSKKDTIPSRCHFIGRMKNKNETNTNTKRKWLYKWNFPQNSILIFDESHRCKNIETINSDLLFTASHYNVNILMLSATACDTEKNFMLFGYVLNLYDSLSGGIDYISSISDGYLYPMKAIHDKIFPRFASRMKISNLGSLFPENSVIAKCYDMDCAEELQQQYNIIEMAVKRLQTEENLSRGIGLITKARMRIEMLKVPTFIKLAKQYREQNKSIAIFVNFTQTLLLLSEQLDTSCLIYGKQSMQTRTLNISEFNQDKERIIICNMKAGGVGISLHDQHGTYERVSIISPSWSAQDILQALGRLHRANGKTNVKQHIIYCKRTIEETICENMKTKIFNIASLNDGELKDYHIDGLTRHIDSNDSLQYPNDDLNPDPLTMAHCKHFALLQTLWRLQREIKKCTKDIIETEQEIQNLEQQKNK